MQDYRFLLGMLNTQLTPMKPDHPANFGGMVRQAPWPTDFEHGQNGCSIGTALGFFSDAISVTAKLGLKTDGRLLESRAFKKARPYQKH